MTEKRLSARELAAWRSRGPVVGSRPLRGDAEDEGFPEPESRSPLHQRETYDAVLRMVWGAGTGQTIKWLRTMIPHAVAHLTDEELLRRVDGLIQRGVTNVTRSRGLYGPVVIPDGR